MGSRHQAKLAGQNTEAVVGWRDVWRHGLRSMTYPRAQSRTSLVSAVLGRGLQKRPVLLRSLKPPPFPCIRTHELTQFVGPTVREGCAPGTGALSAFSPRC